MGELLSFLCPLREPKIPHGSAAEGSDAKDNCQGFVVLGFVVWLVGLLTG